MLPVTPGEKVACPKAKTMHPDIKPRIGSSAFTGPSDP